MQNNSIIKQFRALSANEKLEVLDELWTEAARELEGLPLSEAERKFLEERIQDAESHREEDKDWQVVRAELFKRS